MTFDTYIAINADTVHSRSEWTTLVHTMRFGFTLLTLFAVLSGPAPAAEQRDNWPWSFRPVTHPTVPQVQTPELVERVANPIDAFVFSALERNGLDAAPPADRHELVRRACFDLLGLPPMPEQVDAFVHNESPDAWRDLIEQLLDSPQYGERWGRHWLDVARYADSGGFEGDMSFPTAWRYRDYVVKSFNDDKAYDVFVQEQIAGDELWPDNLDLDPKHVYQVPADKLRHLEARLGTGLYTFGPRVIESALDAKRFKSETLTDWADTTGAVFLGLTLGCARCHDHKFDPLTQKDYYSLQAIFASSTEVDLPVISPMEITSWQFTYPRTVAIEEARTAYKVFRERTAGRELTDEERAEEGRLRNAIVDRVMELPEKGISVPNTPFDPLMQIPTATVLGHERPELLQPVHLLARGELSNPGPEMHPALPAALAEATGREPSVAGPFGSRAELARWLTSPEHPLTARVMVNRIWMWHFGQGLVATPNDFGRMGTPPSHPELLDWLAGEFVARGWSVKEMHRLIMNSSAYQMTSRFGLEKDHAADPDNRLLWRMNRRRLEAEALWDAVHATAGTLNLKMGGRPVVPPLADDEIAALREKWQWPVSGDPSEYTRRGLYVLVLRNFRFPMFEVFDAPVTSVSCPERDVTTVAPQALWTLNSPTVLRQAAHLAARIVKQAGDDRDAQIDSLWMIALSRPIRPDEREDVRKLLGDLKQTDDDSSHKLLDAADASSLEPLKAMSPGAAAALVKLCLGVYNLNEFAFVD